MAVLSRDLGEVLWANGAAAQLFGFSNIYDVLDEGLGRAVVDATANRERGQRAVAHRQAAEFHGPLRKRLLAGDGARKS
ncbi:PAS domain-containing protein [Hoeflea alexandrii]|uniref:PAS domain-containing protein n=1 Tax=Hoeflea alexandrii TaxID=288436 RepID=UPI002D1E39A1|nr:PAS domain-containing protein [Hoeflea alexandrii]